MLSAKERTGLTGAVASQLRPFMSNLGIESEEQLREAAAQVQIKAVDLGDNGAREFLAQGVELALHSHRSAVRLAIGEVWVIRLNGTKYSVILHRTATQTFTIQPTITNGFHDLVLGQHGSANRHRVDSLSLRRLQVPDAWPAMTQTGVSWVKTANITPGRSPI